MLSIKENDYVIAAKSLGLTRVRVVVVHIIPNIFASILVFATLEVATAILGSTQFWVWVLNPQLQNEVASCWSRFLKNWW